MKRFLLIGAACLAFLSCSKDIILDVNRGAAIEFTVAAQTRAQEVTSNNLLTFYVTAVDPRQDINYFTEVPYIKSGEYYHSSPYYYWPGDGAPLNLYAFAPSADDLCKSVSGDEQTSLTIDRNDQILKNFSPAAEISEQQDFISAVLPGFTHPGDGSPVQVPFKHQLVQIEVKAKNSNAGQTYHVKGVSIAQVRSKGDFYFSDERWALDNEAKANYEVIYDDVRILDPFGVNIMEVQDDNAMLLPQTLVPWDPQDDQNNDNKGAYISVLMKITSSSDAPVNSTDNNDGYEWVAAPFPAGTTWEAGNKYIYTLDFTNGASYSDPSNPGGGVLLQNEIKFDVDILPWNTSSSQLEGSQPVEPEPGTWDGTLTGVWDVYNVKISITGGGVVNTLEMPSLEALAQMEMIGEEAYVITFVNHDTFYLNTVDTPSNTLYRDGELYLIDSADEEIKIHSYSESKMKLTSVAEEYIGPDNTGEKVLLEYEFYYIKRGYERDDLRDWEICLSGEWYVCSTYRSRTDLNGNIILETRLNSYEEIVADGEEIDSAFYKLTFVTPYQWSFHGDSTLHNTMTVDGTLSLYAGVDPYRFYSMYDFELLSDKEMKVFTTYEDSDRGYIEYVELNYRKK